MFLKPQTKLVLSRLSIRSLESDTALKLWLALQHSPFRSPRACSQKIGFFCFFASSLASSNDESHLTWSVSLATFFSTTALGTVAPTSFFSTPAGLPLPLLSAQLKAPMANNVAMAMNLFLNMAGAL